MTWMNRLKLGLGLIVILAIVAGGTFVFTQRQARSLSTSAAISATEYSVGTDYGGTVVTADRRPGDEVSAGDVLFVIDSPRLRRDIADGLADESLAEAMDENENLVIRATVDGYVATVDTQPGGYVKDGTVLGSLYDPRSLTVDAELEMTRRDFGRLESGADAEVLLPDGSRLAAVVDQVNVSTVQGIANAEITVDSVPLLARAWTSGVVPGSPVEVTVSLRDDGVFAGVADAGEDFLRKIGLR